MNKYAIFNGIPLPVAFTNEENLRYHRQYKLGDMSARDILIKHNLRLVFRIIREDFSMFNYDIDDLMSIGIIGLIKGIDFFDENKNNNMAGYVSRCIRYEIINFLRIENKHKKKNIDLISFDDVAKVIDGETIPYKDVLVIEDESLEDIVIGREMKKFYYMVIYELLNSLSDRDKKIMMLYFGFIDGKLYKQREIALVVDIDRAGVSRVITSTLRKFKQRILYIQKCDDRGIVNNYSRKLNF